MIAHARYLRSEVESKKPATWIETFQENWTDADLGERERAICTYAAKLALEPGNMRREDLDPLRDGGLEDLAILNLAHIVGFFSHANRIADGLGIELDEDQD